MRRQIGQLLTAGFRGTSIPQPLSSLAREFDLGAVVLFRRNVEEPAQVAELAAEGRALGRELPAWVTIDQEGGRVARLRAPFTEWPAMQLLGHSDDTGLAERFARVLARELAAVGITLDFAPVLDVLTNRDNTAIGDRAFSGDAATVARVGRIVIDTLQREGVAACGKHFPGHGDTVLDSHDALPLVEAPPDRLDAVEMVPFRAAIEAGVASIMVGHLFVPALDGEQPATCSRTIVDGWLRRRLGFTGVVWTDDLDMKAVSARPIDELAVQAIAAGCDGLLICGEDHERQAAALEGLIHAVEDGRLPLAAIEDAFRRHRRAKERFLGAPPARPRSARELRDLVGTEEHRSVADAIAQFA